MVQGKYIVFDIDDVLAKNAEGFARFSNETWGTGIVADDFSEDWMTMWGVDEAEMWRRSDIFHASDAVLHYKPYSEATTTLSLLTTHNKLAVLTSRRQPIAAHTAAWIERYFPDTFADIHYSGIFDSQEANRHIATKADRLVEIGADFIVDDQLKHCLAAAEKGIPAVLFGNFPWNQAEALPSGVIRCVDWKEVEEYFNEQS